MAREKIMLGLGLYGIGWVLADADVNAPGSKTTGASLPGAIVAESGVFAYYEVINNLIN